MNRNKILGLCCLLAVMLGSTAQASVENGVINRSALTDLKPLSEKPMVIFNKVSAAQAKQALRSTNSANLLPPMKAMGIKLEQVQTITMNLQKRGIKPLTD